MQLSMQFYLSIYLSICPCLQLSDGNVTLSIVKLCRCITQLLRYDTRCYFNVRSKANMSQLNLPYGLHFIKILHYIMSVDLTTRGCSRSMFTTVAAAVAMETAFRGISSQPGQLISRNRAASTLSPVIRFWEMGCGVVAPHCKAAATIFAGFRVYRRAIYLYLHTWLPADIGQHSCSSSSSTSNFL